MEKDLFKVYVMTKEGKLAEYMGGPNFTSGKKKCRNCKSEMRRCPLDTPYIEQDGGFITVETTPKNGLMVVTSAESKYIWACSGCSHALQPYKKKATAV